MVRSSEPSPEHRVLRPIPARGSTSVTCLGPPPNTGTMSLLASRSEAQDESSKGYAALIFNASFIRTANGDLDSSDSILFNHCVDRLPNNQPSPAVCFGDEHQERVRDNQCSKRKACIRKECLPTGGRLRQRSAFISSVWGD